MKAHLPYRLISTILIVIISSCIKMEELSVMNSDYIIFKASLGSDNEPDVKSISENYTAVTEDWILTPDTKGEIMTKLDGSATVIGLLSEKGDISASKPWSGLKDSKFSFNGDELSSETPVRWGTIDSRYGNISMFLYSPVSIDGAVLPSDDAAGAPQMTYILPSDIARHTDIIAAHKEVTRANFGQSVPITFNHIFTALKFKMGFSCTVKSLTISGVYNKGTYTIGSSWGGHTFYTDETNNGSYTVTFGEGESGKHIDADTELFDGVMMMIPQTIPFEQTDNPRLTVTYLKDGAEKKISASLKGVKWDEGKMITYTLHEKTKESNYIYFDLAAGNVKITNQTYEGFVYATKASSGKREAIEISGTISAGQSYYVYQSCITDVNKSSKNYKAGYDGYDNKTKKFTGDFTLPSYPPVTYKGQLWSDFITNNTYVDGDEEINGKKGVIQAWDNAAGAGQADSKSINSASVNGSGAKGAVREAGREATKNRIHITGNIGDVKLYIDNIYSSYQQRGSTPNRKRAQGGISFLPAQDGSHSVLTINIIGDNRLGCVNYQNWTDSEKNCLVFEGSGSLTVGDTDYYRDDEGLGSNRSCAVIGGKDEPKEEEDVYNIVFNSGVIYAGATPSTCTAIGGGGNGNTSITINGGTITAVAKTTGTAIGGGTGLVQPGGEGKVTITNGNVYAYNFANTSNVPAAAIGAAGSRDAKGGKGHVTIEGGYVYAYAGRGTAIGGGSSAQNFAGDGTIIISGGTVIAKTEGRQSVGIGGGSSYTSQYNPTTGDKAFTKNGGSAQVTITGNPIIRTGSIGGGTPGKGESKGGKIGSAKINVKGGDIQAQFVMADSDGNVFDMSGGVIRNSSTSDTDYECIQDNGGAVYMEKGTFVMSGGEIKNCTGKNGGAVYIKGTSATTFTMNGGSILQSTALNNGGALYLDGGTVTLNGGTISRNLAQKGNGGGIYIKGGNFTMPELSTAEISKNAAYSRNSDGFGSGGGVYVTSTENNVTVDILSGTIQGNSADRYGGGLGVVMSGSTNIAANVSVGIENDKPELNPLITGNRASIQGGGLYVNGALANITINDGKIMDNLIAGYSHNPNVANEGGMVTLNGGDVTHVVVTYMPNGGTIILDGNTVSSVTQNIVTSTNSKMSVPGTFQRTGWVVDHWHTRQDGDNTKGKRYEIGGILNLDESIILYAQWRETTGSGQ